MLQRKGESKEGDSDEARLGIAEGEEDVFLEFVRCMEKESTEKAVGRTYYTSRCKMTNDERRPLEA